MDREPSEASPSSSLDSHRRTREPRFDDSDEDLLSLVSSETPSHPPTQQDSPVPGSDGDGASSSRVLPLMVEDGSTDTEWSEEHPPSADDCTDSYVSDEGSHSADDCADYEGSDEDSLSEDSEGSNPVMQWKSRGKDKEHTGLICLSTVEILSGRITGQPLDFRLPCTATEGTTCQIVNHLSAWNEFFCMASWRLQEMPGTSVELSLVLLTDSCKMYCSSQDRHLAILLVGQLLKTHHCVSHVELGNFLLKKQAEILSDALREHPSITSVKFVFYCWVNAEDLVTAALSLPRLQELEYSGDGRLPWTLVARLSTFFQTTTSLTALRVSKGCPKGLSREDFFRGLGQNCSLKELVLPIHLLAKAPPRAQEVFTEWLTNSVSLKSLTVTSHHRECVPLKHVLRAILANRSIVAMLFECSKVDRSDVQFLSKIFEENKVVRSFKVWLTPDSLSTVSSFVRGCQGKADCDRCLKALIGNHTLEEVALPFNVLDEGQWKELFEALPAKRNLKKVCIEALHRAPPFLVGKLCTALKETGADETVSFNGSFTEEVFSEVCACKSCSSVVLSARSDNEAVVSRMLEHMPSLSHITYLHVDISIIHGLDGVLSSALATFLGATRTLKTLSLHFFQYVVPHEWQEGLMDGLAHITSLREIRIKVEETSFDFSTFSEPLADAISASKNISRVYLREPFFGEGSFLQRLSTGIVDNFTLLNATVGKSRYIEFTRSRFKVWDTTRRNCGLLTNAADFARGARCDRRCAEALERMHSHLELVEEVARLEGVEEARAAAMVRNGLRSMEGLHDFMRLVGVVQERVSCHAREDGRMQLDALNEDCWKVVRGYLKLRDVKDGME